MIDAAGKRPFPGQHIPAPSRDCGAGRSKAGAAERVGAGAPQFALRRHRIMAKGNAVGQRAVDRPAGRGAGGRYRQRDFERDDGVAFEPAELFRPGRAQQFGVTDLGDDRGRDHTVALGLLGERPDLGHQRAGAGDQLLRARRADAADRGGSHRRLRFRPAAGLPCNPFLKPATRPRRPLPDRHGRPARSEKASGSHALSGQRYIPSRSRRRQRNIRHATLSCSCSQSRLSPAARNAPTISPSGWIQV